MTEDNKVQLIAEYVYNDDLSFLVDVVEEHRENIYCTFSFDNDSGAITGVTYSYAWDGRDADGELTYPLAELIELIPEIWDAVDAIHKASIKFD